VPRGESDDGIAGYVEGLQRFALFISLGIREEIQAGGGPGDVGFEVQHSLAIYLAVQDGVAGRALLHELSDDACIVGIAPFLRELGEHPAAHRTTAPVRDDVLAIEAHALLVDAKPGLGTRIEDAQVVQAVARQLGVCRYGLRTGSAFETPVCCLRLASSMNFRS
jgi:hypothetical protein